MEQNGLILIGAGKDFKEVLCSMIETTQMFGDFEWRDIQDLSHYMEAYKAPMGATLFREGDQGSYMCLIIEGEVEVVKEDLHETRKVMATITAGKTLGEMALIDGQPRSASAITSVSTTLTILTKANFQHILRDKPALAAKILLKIASLLSQRLRFTSGLLVDYLE